MASVSTIRATLDDLYREEGKAELIGGRIVRMSCGDRPNEVASEIFVSLRAYAKSTKQGVARTDGIGYTVSEMPSGRESFSPDASYYLIGQRPVNRMRFVEGAPTFAVEVRSENDYGAAAEIEMADKRADYFQAGTLVVWDVDPKAETVAVYRAADPTLATIYRRGDSAEAEPAIPGWVMAVDEIFAG